MQGESISERHEDEFLICYLDLMGYKQLVTEYRGNETVISGIEKAFKEVLGRNEGLKTREAKTPFALGNRIAAEHIEVALISDSMLFRMPTPENLPLLSKEIDASLSAYCYVVIFLSAISDFYRWIAGTTGHFFRGAVTRGQHHESRPVSSRNLFVFSEALIAAVELAEQRISTPKHSFLGWFRKGVETGGPPWVLLDESMVRYLEHLTAQVSEDQRMEMTRREKERIYLDIYFPLNSKVNVQHPNTRSLLEDIVEAVIWQVNRNQKKRDVVKKYRWFADYHNLRMKELGIEDKGLIIDL